MGITKGKIMKKHSNQKGWALVLTIAMALTTAFGGFGFVGMGGAVEEVYALPGPALTVGTGGVYPNVTAALAVAVNGDTITLLNDIIESVSYTVVSGKEITIDGAGYTITGIAGASSAALTLSGEGTIALKDITLQGGTATLNAGTSTGLKVTGSVNVQSINTVNSNGGEASNNGISYGLWATGTGMVNVSSATGGDNSFQSFGVFSSGSGTVNVTTARGGIGNNSSNASMGVSAKDNTTVNVITAIGDIANNSFGVDTQNNATVNVNTATGGIGVYASYGVAHSAGTVNANIASGSTSGAIDISYAGSYGVIAFYTAGNNTGTVNVTAATGGTAIGADSSSYGVFRQGGTVNVTTPTCGTAVTAAVSAGTVNTGTDVTTLTLNKGTGANCVLDSITIAASGTTNVGTLPQVSKDGVVGHWFTDIAKTTQFTGTAVTSERNLYSTFCEATVPGAPTIGTATRGDSQASVTFTAPVSNGGTAITGYTVTSSPGGLTGVGAASPITVTGLTNGTPYTFTVTATNSAGTGAASAASNSITPASPSGGGNGGGSTGSTTINTNTGSVTGAQLNNAAGVASNGGTVTINANQAGEVSFPTSGLDSLIDKDNSLTVITENGTLTFDGKAVNAMGGQASGEEIIVTVEEVDYTKLTEEQQEKVGDKTVYDLTVMSDGKLISSFNGGKVNVSIPYELKAGETTDNITVWYLADDGSLKEIACVYDEKTKSVTFVVDHFSKYMIGYDALAGWVNPFADVKSSDWYYNAVASVNNDGLMNGQTATAFDGEGAMTRGMFVTILGRMEGVNTAAYASLNTFSDVANAQYYAPYIAWASEHDIVSGVGNGQYAPEQAITREQMAVMMTNYMKFKEQGPVGLWAIQLTYGDLDKISSWTGDAVMFMTLKGLMTGMGNDADGKPLFAPGLNSTRAQTAQVIMRLAELLK
ncbi:MAG: hypothetical protein EOM59_04935 [Clostridia bacterium]|nr:hypothetical protein [Clostridia bacterium]